MTNIKSIRESKGLTQKQLADKIGTTQPCVCNWESGTSDPRTADLPRIADALGVSIDELVRGKEGSA